MNDNDVDNLERPLAVNPTAGAAQDERGEPRRGKQFKRDKRDVHGWVALDKPVGMTSTHAVSVVKRLFSAKRVGHAGTLDPLASGALPIALGEATKTVPFVMDGRKLYRFTVRWGEERDTDDAEGRVVARSNQRPSADAIRALLPSFTGCIQQVPPRYSAIKIEGERAYDLARDVLTKITTDGVSHAPVWTPDGANLCFRSWKAGTMTMWEMPWDRSRPEQRILAVLVVRWPDRNRRGPRVPDKAVALLEASIDVHVARIQGLVPYGQHLLDNPFSRVGGAGILGPTRQDAAPHAKPIHLECLSDLIDALERRLRIPGRHGKIPPG